MAKVSVLEGWLCGFLFRSFQNMNSMLLLLIQRAGKSRSGISQTKSTAVSQEWYRLKSSDSFFSLQSPFFNMNVNVVSGQRYLGSKNSLM